MVDGGGNTEAAGIPPNIKKFQKKLKTLHRKKKKTHHGFHARLKKNFTIPTVGLVHVKGDKFTPDPLVNFSRNTSKSALHYIKKKKKGKTP
jgi:hypothetical protein